MEPLIEESLNGGVGGVGGNMNCQQTPLNTQMYLSYHEESTSTNHLTLDSAYGSGYSLISNSTVNESINNNNNKYALTPLKQQKSHVITDENTENSTKLTPVTQNIHRICNFHITTPKSNDLQNFMNYDNNNEIIDDTNSLKRISEFSCEFDSLQSTPKKFKISDNLQKKHDNNLSPYKQKTQQHNSTNKISFRQKLHSAPDFEAYFENNENFLSPQKLTNIKNRTPLSISNVGNSKIHQQFSTPIENIPNIHNNNKNMFLESTTSYNNKSNSVHELLSCTDEQFDNILKSGDKTTKTSQFHDAYNLYKSPFCNESHKASTSTIIKTPFRRVLSFDNESDSTTVPPPQPAVSEFLSPKNVQNNVGGCNTLSLSSSTTSDNNGLSIFENNYHNFHQKSYPNVSTVLNDRLIARKRAVAARLANFEDVNTKKLENTTSPERKKNISNTSYDYHMSSDMNISPISKTFKLKTLDDFNIVPIVRDNNNSITAKEITLENNSSNMIISPYKQLSNEHKSVDNLYVKLLESDDEKNTPFKNTQYLKNKQKFFDQNSNDMKDISSLSKPIDKLTTDKIMIPPFSPATQQIHDDLLTFTQLKREISFEDDIIGKSLEIQSQQQQQDEQQQQQQYHHPVLPKTPRKLQTFNNEKFEILYPTIPITPHKNYHNTTNIHSPKKKQQQLTLTDRRSSNNTQYNNFKKFYNGAIYLNIIAKLETIPIIIDRIFDYLSSRDLLNLTMCTKTYGRIVKSNLKAERRLVEFLQEYQINKENYCGGGEKNKTEICCKRLEPIENINNNNCKIMPFIQNNSKLERKRTLDVISSSPPVTPSKKKFHEHQKVVKTLSETDCIIRCPRCAKASRYVTSAPISFQQIDDDEDDEMIYNNIPRKQSIQTFQTFFNLHNKIENNNGDDINGNSPSLYTVVQSSKSLTHSTEINNCSTAKLIKSVSVDSGFSINEIKSDKPKLSSFQPYGQCTNISCKFLFCVQCTSEYHPGSKCKIAPASPTKDDVQDGGLCELLKTPKSKSNQNTKKFIKRKSLKRLCF